MSLALYGNVHVNAQQDTSLFVKDALKENRVKEYKNIVKNGITKNLSLPLNDSTEEYWQNAFWSMELISYKSSWVKIKINTAFDSIQNRSLDFQRALLELAYSNYKKDYVFPVNQLIKNTDDAKIFAMCSEYLLQNDTTEKTFSFITSLLAEKFIKDKDDPIIKMLNERLQYFSKLISKKNTEITGPKNILKDILNKSVLPNSVIVYSFQRRNRNYPGLAIIRNKEGNIITNENGAIISIPQLARSVSNLPGYLTNGNTPEGIFRMDGFDTSLSGYIGPTTNIQLTMPHENSITHFLKDSTITDSTWNEKYYKAILPDSWKNYSPIYQTYYAGKAGRAEIIAHGTTVNPEYYKSEPYYPLTPTQGCLCTKEIWSEENGKRLQSNQQKLVDTVQQAGGPDGYLIVIELDDKNKPVTIEELISYLPK
ncbi:MAG: hypothetical protein IPJ81_09780 [Chitinophagaceae bacterium]|nr:hypothetical protein [Chitinophagaceae bacterium]